MRPAVRLPAARRTRPARRPPPPAPQRPDRRSPARSSALALLAQRALSKPRPWPPRRPSSWRPAYGPPSCLQEVSSMKRSSARAAARTRPRHRWRTLAPCGALAAWLERPSRPTRSRRGSRPAGSWLRPAIRPAWPRALGPHGRVAKPLSRPRRAGRPRRGRRASAPPAAENLFRQGFAQRLPVGRRLGASRCLAHPARRRLLARAAGCHARRRRRPAAQPRPRPSLVHETRRPRPSSSAHREVRSLMRNPRRPPPRRLSQDLKPAISTFAK